MHHSFYPIESTGREHQSEILEEARQMRMAMLVRRPAPGCPGAAPSLLAGVGRELVSVGARRRPGSRPCRRDRPAELKPA